MLLGISARTLLVAVKTGTVTALLAVVAVTGLGPGLTSATASHHLPRSAAGSTAGPRCPDVARSTAARDAALIRTARGQLAVVPFSQAWAIYTGRRPGTFLTVCNQS